MGERFERFEAWSKLLLQLDTSESLGPDHHQAQLAQSIDLAVLEGMSVRSGLGLVPE